MYEATQREAFWGADKAGLELSKEDLTEGDDGLLWCTHSVALKAVKALFNQMSVGIQFVQRKSKTEERLSTALGASVPYLQRYWGYHSGSVAGDLNFFL